MRALLLCLLASLSIPALQNATTWTSGYPYIWKGVASSFRDRAHDIRPLGSGQLAIAGSRGDSQGCPITFSTSGPWFADSCKSVTYQQASLQIWDPAGATVWERPMPGPAPSLWTSLSILPDGSLLTGGGFAGDTVTTGISVSICPGARIARWSADGRRLWQWRLFAPVQMTGLMQSYYPTIRWTMPYPDGSVAFLGSWTADGWFTSSLDTVDLSSYWRSGKRIPSSGTSLPFVGRLSSDGQLLWLRPFATEASWRSSFATLRGSDLIVARSPAIDSSNRSRILLSLLDSSGTLLAESLPLDTTIAQAAGLSGKDDGTLLLSIHLEQDSMALGGKMERLAPDANRFDTGSNVLLRLDRTRRPLGWRTLTGYRHPAGWDIEPCDRGWLAWGSDWSGLSDTANLILLDDSLQVQEVSPLLGSVRNVHAHGDEIWFSGTVQGAAVTGNGGNMMATRMDFDPTKPVANTRSTATSAHMDFSIQPRRLTWLGASDGSLRIISPSGLTEWQGRSKYGISVPLEPGVHVLQFRSQAHQTTRGIVVP